MTDTARRDYLIGEAVAAGKFMAERAPFYRERYDRDPAGTEQVLAMLAPALAGVAGLEPAPYPRELFPELDRRARRAAGVPATFAPAATAPPAATAAHARPVTPAAESALTPEQVGAWSHELGFDRVEASVGRVARAND
jgi:hypothetical protein